MTTYVANVQEDQTDGVMVQDMSCKVSQLAPRLASGDVHIF